MFRGCLGDVLGMFGGCLGDVLVMFGGCFGDVLVMFGACFGDVLGWAWDSLEEKTRKCRKVVIVKRLGVFFLRRAAKVKHF